MDHQARGDSNQRGSHCGSFLSSGVAHGGTFPPWYTLAQAQTLQEQLQKQQAEIAARVKETADALMVIVDKLNRDQCIDANRRLNNARMRVNREPNNATEREIYEAVLREVLGIPGCSIMPQ